MNVTKNFTSIEQIRGRMKNREPKRVIGEREKNTPGFDEILFSKHASRRLETRQIDMSDEQRARLQDATSQAREKGMKESLVMVDSLVFIVNIPNHTVVTAMDQTQANENVYTNIDGAVIM